MKPPGSPPTRRVVELERIRTGDPAWGVEEYTGCDVRRCRQEVGCHWRPVAWFNTRREAEVALWPLSDTTGG